MLPSSAGHSVRRGEPIVRLDERAWVPASSCHAFARPNTQPSTPNTLGSDTHRRPPTAPRLRPRMARRLRRRPLVRRRLRRERTADVGARRDVAARVRGVRAVQRRGSVRRRGRALRRGRHRAAAQHPHRRLQPRDLRRARHVLARTARGRASRHRRDGRVRDGGEGPGPQAHRLLGLGRRPLRRLERERPGRGARRIRARGHRPVRARRGVPRGAARPGAARPAGRPGVRRAAAAGAVLAVAATPFLPAGVPVLLALAGLLCSRSSRYSRRPA